MSNHAELAKRCRALETAFIRLQKDTGRDYQKDMRWAREWASALLDTRCPTQQYEDWLVKQEERVLRLVRDSIKQVSA